MADASVHCWGSNALGSVGVKGPSPTQQYHRTPQLVRGVQAKQLLLLGTTTCVRGMQDGVSCWGGKLSNADASPRPIERLPSGKLVASEATGCVVAADGGVTCWGENTSGRLSPGDEPAVRETFGTASPPHLLAIGAAVTTVAIGGRHGCGLGVDKRVRCWGLNNFGQLGVESSVGQRATPAVVAGLDDVSAIVSGYFHTCAMKGDGTVWCWGRGDDGQLGIGDGAALVGQDEHRHHAQPAQVEGLPKARVIAATSSESCAITTDGELWCWGSNKHGELGDGTSQSRFLPVRVTGLRDVISVAIGEGTTCALTEVGEVYCWGRNEDGALGNGGVESSAVPVKVVLPHDAQGSTSSESAPPSAPLAGSQEILTHESLACGFRFKAAGKRVYKHVDDLDVDVISLEHLADARTQAHCTLVASQSDKDPDTLAKRFASEGAEAGVHATQTRRRIGDADCLELASPQSRSLFCFGPELFIALSAGAKDVKIAEAVASSLEIFDRNAQFPATPPPSTVPAPPGMVAIAGGEFAMGCANRSLLHKPSGELGCREDSQPLHRVRLSPYAIDKTEVTWGDYHACVTASACQPTGERDYMHPETRPQRPVRNVSWDQASAYCKWKGKRLPTEAEWERAARGTDFRSRPWGNDPGDCEHAQLLSCRGETGPIDVGQRPLGASPDGVLDLVGNVKEWVNDAFAKTYYLESPAADPKGPTGAAIHRTIRGSSYMTAAGSAAVTGRYGSEPSRRDDELGFRCAK